MEVKQKRERERERERKREWKIWKEGKESERERDRIGAIFCCLLLDVHYLKVFLPYP